MRSLFRLQEVQNWNKFLLFSGLHHLDDPVLMQQWFQLVRQKNSLSRYESELLIL